MGIALRGRVSVILRHTWKTGITTGILLYAGYITNALGLMTINSSTSGFLTALYVPFTPLMIWVVFGKKPDVNAILGVLIAFAGLLLLANPFTLSFSNNFGEWVTILCAFISATEIIMVGLVAAKNEALPLTFTQLTTVAVLCAVTRLVGPYIPLWPFAPTEWTPTLLASIIWLGFYCGLCSNAPHLGTKNSFRRSSCRHFCDGKRVRCDDWLVYRGRTGLGWLVRWCSYCRRYFNQ